MSKIPKKGQRFLHHNGCEYTVIEVANVDSKRHEYPITIVYQGSNGKVWAKTLSNFLRKMTFVD